MKKRLSNKYVVIGILAFLLISMGTYAMFTWRASVTTDVAVSVDGVKVLYVKGPDIINATLVPSFTKEDGIVKEIKVSLDKVPQATVTLNFYLDIIGIAEELIHETFKWELYKNGSLLNGNNFSLVSNGNTITLTTNQTVTTTKDTYKLYIWIDGNVDNPDTMGGKAFSFKLRADGNNAIYEEACGISPIKPDVVSNAPKLASNMIPVRYDECEGVWIKANPTSDWYNYNDKKWANAVTVTAASRTKYLNAPVGEPVLEDDVLTYLVWIPRYKYQLFNSGNGTSVPVQEINVEFESGTSTTGTVSCTVASNGVETCTNDINGNWYTHPAFTFGNEELTGLWVGKFETGGTVLTSCTSATCSTSSLTIKPNSRRDSYQVYVASMFYSVRSMSRSGNEFGFIGSEVDTHMAKNMEWGAIVYLTQSGYGRCTDGVCTEVCINPSSNNITGRSGTFSDSSKTTDTSGVSSLSLYGYDGRACSSKIGFVCTGAKHATHGTSASTTGNIYGVYDMSGGSDEYVMANMVDASGIFYSSEGYFNGTTRANPEDKYYDKYEYDSSSNLTHNRGHLGDATRETIRIYGNSSGGWYNDIAKLMVSTFPWLYRSGNSTYGSTAGIFRFEAWNGLSNGGSYDSFRVSVQVK